MTEIRRSFLVAFATAALVSAGCGDDDGITDPVDGGGPDPLCGNSVVEGTEQCDDGNPTKGDGCEPTCTFSCNSDADCSDGDDCNGAEACHPTLHRCQAAAIPPDGTACSYYETIVVSTTPGLDGGSGLGDGGLAIGDGGTGFEEVQVRRDDGVCVAQTCGKPCTDNIECDDLDFCNGVETCDTATHHVCVLGVVPDCDDGFDCTADSCVPATGCENTLTDVDGDGYAPEGLACGEPYQGGDCDDSAETGGDVYPGAQEICDEKDNDCDGQTDEEEPTWYQDCDGDGFAKADATNQTQCAKPPTTAQCLDWTTVTPSNVSYIDCDDSFNVVRPGQSYQSKPYCKGAGTYASGSYGSFACAAGTLSWDYDCSGGVSIYYTYPTYIGNSCWSSYSHSDDYYHYYKSPVGWFGGAPQCGQSASYGQYWSATAIGSGDYTTYDCWTTNFSYTLTQYCK